MIMKRFLINICFLALLPFSVTAQIVTDSLGTDSVLSSKSLEMERHLQEDSLTIAALNEKIARYEARLARRNRVWMSLRPNFYRFQYAGSIGLLNLGAGWHYGKRHQWETDFMFGYVPRYDKDEAFATFTLRESFIPWRCHLYSFKSEKAKEVQLSCQRLSCGIFFNSVLRGDYWTREPERYPDRNYYRFSSKIRLHLFIGQRYTIHIPKNRRYLIKDLSAVWELSSCDLYLISKFVNSSLPAKDIFSLSFGIKAGI